MVLDRLHEDHGSTILIHGDARDADRLAGKWAVDRGVEVLACRLTENVMAVGLVRSTIGRCSNTNPICSLPFLVAVGRRIWLPWQRRSGAGRDC